MTDVVINGMFCMQKTTGVHRYARELLCALDPLVQEGEFDVLVPSRATDVPEFKNLRIVRYGKHRGLLWEQLDLPRYAKKHNCVSVNLCNSQPFLRSGIMCIHDTAYKTHPEFFRTAFGKASIVWHRSLFRHAARSKYPIITVSYFSKYSIIDTYDVLPNRVQVIGNAWQHIMDIQPDELALERLGLVPGGYYFTLGNINYNKNARWVVEYARKHPDQLFVLSGIRSKNSSVDLEAPNVRWLGYLSDGEIVALYQACKAFIFPSIHEGFGIPPMEALALGAPVVVSNATCLPEIYRDVAHYIDPYDTNVDLEALLAEPVESASAVLDRYSWEDSARSLRRMLNEFREATGE